jgi:protein-tyrosine-phosphatase
MKNRHYPLVILVFLVLEPGLVLAQPSHARDTADYPTDPRVAAVAFYRHIRNGEAEEAWGCWDPDAGKTTDAKYERTQVRDMIALWIAQFRLEQAVMKKLPQL